MVTKGWQPEWEHGPPLEPRLLPPKPPLPSQKQKLLDQAVEEELLQGVIVPISRRYVLWEHSVFQIPKKDGKLRKIVDCSDFNFFLFKRHFKMEDHRLLQQLLRRGWWATSLDISSAYHHVPVWLAAAPYLCFSNNGQIYAYVAMPFGISTAPRTFTMLMRLCIEAIRQRWQVTALHYLDDLLFLHPDPTWLFEATQQIMRFLTWLGGVLNSEKSEPVPKQTFVYLGWEWDSLSCSVRLPQTKAKTILNSLALLKMDLSAAATTTARRLAKAIGMMNSCRFQFRQASLHLRHLDSFKTAAVAEVGWDGRVSLCGEELKEEVDWWISTLTANRPRTIAQTPPQAVMFTDASPIGWGAHVQLKDDPAELVMHGRWRRKATSNALECAAVEKGLRRLRQLPEGRAVTSLIVRSDNTSTCYNINRQAACDTLLPTLVSLLSYADRVGVELTAEHVAGVDNAKADRLSRISPGGDYALHADQLQRIQQQWEVQIDADLFAAGWNRKHAVFFSLRRDRQARGRDAFLIRWNQFDLPLLHPPLPLIPKVLHRLQQEKMKAILIAPLWTRQAWSNQLTAMTKRVLNLGPAESVFERGRGMAKVRAELPPGDVAAFFLDTRTTTASASSIDSCASTASATTSASASSSPTGRTPSAVIDTASSSSTSSTRATDGLGTAFARRTKRWAFW